HWTRGRAHCSRIPTLPCAASQPISSRAIPAWTMWTCWSPRTGAPRAIPSTTRGCRRSRHLARSRLHPRPGACAWLAGSSRRRRGLRTTWCAAWQPIRCPTPGTRGGVRAPRRNQSGPLRRGHRRHGAVRSQHGRQPVFPHAFRAAAPRRHLHDLWARGEWCRRVERDRDGRSDQEYSSMRRWLICLLGLALGLASSLPAQYGYFGQNKIQYRRFDWRVLRGEHVDLYYYPEEEELGRVALAYAEA